MMKNILLLVVIVLECIGCNQVLETINFTNGSKLIISSVQQKGEVYRYTLNKYGRKKIIWDEYGYTSTNRYNVGDTLIIKIELYSD